jgi:elongation factor P
VSTMQYMYSDGEAYHFMNTETYEQVGIQAAVLGSDSQWLLESMQVEVLFYKGQPINIELPNFVEMEVIYTEPGVAGNTAQGARKEAELQSGAKVQVPLFITTGEVLKIDTRTGEYVERVNRK